ncbi:MAG: carbohydrate porin [Proteobacteria bacterium]|nr:carbohydrate porin [Pseudomonadota bacterium]MBQ9818052.1 carbohydrate porin [Pseudomonadota bacterium]
MRKSLFLVTGFAAFACCSTVFAQEEASPANAEITAEPSDSETNQAPQQATPAPKDFEFAIAKGAQPASKTDVENTEKNLQSQIDALQSEIKQLREENEAARNEAAQNNKVADYFSDRFRFGSYGRVQPSMNPDGMKSGRQPRIVYPSPRVDEASYVELTLAYTPYRGDDGTIVDVVTTLAIDGDKLFHYTGQWDNGFAIRNLYAEVRNLWFDGFIVWAGSRMYRGDDIYLLDTWPLDNLNTYGGGIGWHGKTRTNIDIHFGTNRLLNDYQYEVVGVANERFVGESDIVYLDRQRFISSLKAEQLFGGDELPLFKLKLYAEIHAIGEGEYLKTQPEIITKLPSDNGWLVGAQFGISNFLNDSYVNLFIKYAAGLAAYGEMAIPFGFNTEKKAEDAKNFTAGLSAGINILDYVDILFGGYVRYFTDSDGIEEDFDDGVEGVWDIRITGHIGKYFRPGIELSQQLRHPNGVNVVSQKQELASIFKFSVLPAVRLGDGILGRPEIRFNYTMSKLNQAARDIFPEKDLLRQSEYVHFIGLAAEWWFNI